MVEQYPHIATITTQGTDATQDANGNWIEGTPDVTTTLKCRAESATANGFLTSVDGTKIDYSWIVYFPISGNQPFSYVSPGSENVVVTVAGGTCPKISAGTPITVIGSDGNGGTETVLSDTVKRFSRGQLNARVWL